MFFISYEELFLSHIMRDFDHKSMHKKTLKKKYISKNDKSGSDFYRCHIP